MSKEQTLFRSKHVARTLDVPPPDTNGLPRSRIHKATKADKDISNVPAETVGTKQRPLYMENRRGRIVFKKNIISGTFPGNISPYKKIAGNMVIIQTPNQLIKRLI